MIIHLGSKWVQSKLYITVLINCTNTEKNSSTARCSSSKILQVIDPDLATWEGCYVNTVSGKNYMAPSGCIITDCSVFLQRKEALSP